MKRTLLIAIALIIIVGLCGSETLTPAQGPPNSTATRLVYHNGGVMTDTPGVMLIWYGCWSAACGNPEGEAAKPILNDFLSSLSSSPYFQINSTYTDGNGVAASGDFINGSISEADPLASFGLELTDSVLKDIVRDRIGAGRLPLFTKAIYIVLGAPNVSSPATGFCTAVGARPYHSSSQFFDIRYKYAFVGDPKSCPSLEAPQFVADDETLLPTPNGNLTADAMAAKLAHVLSTIVTNPYGDGWYDRFGLENADKCQGKFGQTYTTANGARANIHLGQRDFLVQQNWVNDRPGNRCVLSQ